MESKINYNSNNLNEYNENNNINYKLEFCRHLQNKNYNSYINNHTEKVKNFYNLQNGKNSILDKDERRNYSDNYFIKNMQLDKILINNTQSFSYNSTNREGCIFTIAFNQTGSIMGSTNHNHHIEIWDMQEKRIKKVIRDHKEIVTGLEFLNGDQNLMMSCSLDKTIQLWKDFENIHTFVDHSDWVRCISVSKENQKFLSGCVSSVIKLWDLNTQKVIQTITNPNPDPDLLNTVNSLHFMNNNENIFLCGLRNGSVKIFDSRISSVNEGMIYNFKAHKNKLNTVKFNKSDNLLLSSGRDSLVRLWDMRNLPTTEDPDINSNYCINQYKGHLCKGFNIDCNFFNSEKYVITGSEDSYVYIYDTLTSNLVNKIKTNQKCVNLVKPLPDKSSPYSFVFTGLEDLSIHLWGINKVVSKNIEKQNAFIKKENVETDPNEYNENIEISDVNNPESSLQMKLVEEIMAECGDIILRIFHSNNLTYSNGMNFEHLMEAIQKNNDSDSMRLMQILNEKFLKKMMESFSSELRGTSNKDKSKSKTKITKQTKSENKNIHKINCLLCDEKFSESLISVMEVDRNNLDNILRILDFPNDYDSFTNTLNDDEYLNKIESKSNEGIIPKNLYSNENMSFKYNYLLNKYI